MTTPLNFDARTVDPSQAYSAIPTGWYTARITEVEMKPTKDADGSYLRIEFTIISGPYLNRKLFTNLNLVNKNPTAVEIANKDLSAICHAIQRLVITNAEDLLDGVLDVRAKFVAATDQYEEQNEIKGYDTAGKKATVDTQGAAPAQPGATMQAPAPQPQAPAPQPVPQAQYAPQYAPAAPAAPAAAPANPVPPQAPTAAPAPQAPAPQAPAPVANQAPVVHTEPAPAPQAPVAPVPQPQAHPQAPQAGEAPPWAQGQAGQ